MKSLLSTRFATLVLSFVGAAGNAFMAAQVISLWRSLKWEAIESEWESSYSSWTTGVDSIKLVWALLAIYFSVSTVACVVGFIGALKLKSSYVRLYRDCSVADLSVTAFATVIFSLASFRPSVRASICEELSRQPELMRDLAEAGLDLENCEPWFERAVVVIVGVMAIILVVRLQFTLAVSNFYSQLIRTRLHRTIEDGFESETGRSSAPRRIYLLPSRSQSLPSATQDDLVVYAPVPLSSLSPQETHDLDAAEAWVSHADYQKHRQTFSHHRRSSSSGSRSPSRHHRHRSSANRIRLPTMPNEPLLPEYSGPKSEA